MSEEIAAKRMEEIEVIEKQESIDQERIKQDACPVCGQFTITFPYQSFFPIYGWLECPGCGTVFAPKSIRTQKLSRASQVIEKPNIIV